MAKKKIVIEDNPEETDAKESAATAESSLADTEMSATETQPDTESEQPSDETAQAKLDQGEDDATINSSANPHLPVHDKPNMPRQKMYRRRYQLAAIAIMLILVISGVYLLLEPTNPLPKADMRLAKFKVYYPKSNTSGYTYISGSANFTAGQLTYSLEPKNSHVGAGGPIIRITEQALKGKGPNLSALTNFTLLKEPAGNAAVGNNGAIVNGVIVTKKTLIIVNGIDGATKQDVLAIMKSM